MAGLGRHARSTKSALKYIRKFEKCSHYTVKYVKDPKDLPYTGNYFKRSVKNKLKRSYIYSKVPKAQLKAVGMI